MKTEDRLSRIWQIIVSIGICCAWMVLLKGRQNVRGTTLTTAWTWSVLAATAWTVTWFADSCWQQIPTAIADHVWYACAVLSLCPPIAVLGSRRPGTRVWTAFILLPMLLALCWPVGASWFQGSELRGLQLEAPQLLAFVLVLVMGVGNYCGTAFTLSALLYGGSLFTMVLSSSELAPSWLTPPSTTRFWCTNVVILAVLLSKVSTRPTPATRFDRLWFDFFDMFGLVWGRRIQDRINFIANSEGLAAHLELEGFVWSKSTSEFKSERISDLDSSQPEIQLSLRDPEIRVEEILRWLLRRFVDPVWIDERIGTEFRSQIPKVSVDS